MGNKLTPKQALQVLNRNLFDLSINPYADKNFEEKNESFDIVEQALAELEKVKKTNKELQDRCLRLDKDHGTLLKQIAFIQKVNNNDDYEKQIQVLEILKKKQVNLQLMTSCTTYKEYNFCIFLAQYALTPTEFNLIKEWLNNEEN